MAWVGGGGWNRARPGHPSRHDGIEQQLRLLRDGEGMLTDGTMPEILFARTNGVGGLLKKR